MRSETTISVDAVAHRRTPENVEIELHGVTKIFGSSQQERLVLQLLEQGLDREDIRTQTGATVGVHRASFSIYRGDCL